MKSQSCFAAPRGNPTQGGKLRQSTTSTVPSLLQLKQDESVTRSSTETLIVYTQRNVFYEVQKALAINIMITAMSQWNCSIVEAEKRVRLLTRRL